MINSLDLEKARQESAQKRYEYEKSKVIERTQNTRSKQIFEKGIAPTVPGETGSQGPKGDPFTYEDFTTQQLIDLTGPQGEPGLNGSDASVTKVNVEAVLIGEISTHTHAGSSLTLGDLSTNAYPGDKGKTAYDHSQTTHAPSGATIGADWNSNLSNIPSTFTPSTHIHDYEPVKGLDDNYVTDAEKVVIGNTSGTNSGDNATNSNYSGLATSKQDTLVSGTNIKTINGTSIVGSGDVVISGSAPTSWGKYF